MVSQLLQNCFTGGLEAACRLSDGQVALCVQLQLIKQDCPYLTGIKEIILDV
jgi:hypothetical protein